MCQFLLFCPDFNSGQGQNVSLSWTKAFSLTFRPRKSSLRQTILLLFTAIDSMLSVTISKATESKELRRTDPIWTDSALPQVQSPLTLNMEMTTTTSIFIIPFTNPLYSRHTMCLIIHLLWMYIKSVHVFHVHCICVLSHPMSGVKCLQGLFVSLLVYQDSIHTVTQEILIKMESGLYDS